MAWERRLDATRIENPRRLSAVDGRHHVLGIALAGGGVGREDFVNAAEVIGGESHFQGGDVFFQIFSALGAGNVDDVVTAEEDPGEGELRGLAAFLLGDLLDAMDKVEIFLEIFSLETRRVAAVVIGGEIFEAMELSSEKSAAERTVSDEADAEFA